MDNINPPPDASIIEVNGRSIDPHDFYAHDARNTNFIIITARHVLSVAEESKLKGLGVELLENLGNDNFLCWYEPDDLEVLRNVDFVRQVDVYRNKFKIPWAFLPSEEEKSSGKEVEINVIIHDKVTDIEALAKSIAERLNIPLEDIQVLNGMLHMPARVDQMESIATDQRVRFLEVVDTPRICDSEANHIISSPAHSSGLATAGLIEFRGSEQVVAVADSGFDLGSTTNCHPAFRDKVINLSSWGRETKQGSTEESRVDDPMGHGTHVAGTILGAEIETTKGMVGGIAPSASLVFQSLLKWDGFFVKTNDHKALFSQAYTDFNARIHSNSWGWGPVNKESTLRTRPYGSPGIQIDQFVRDNPDMLICFSAGNENLNMNPPGAVAAKPKSSIGCQASAKNCLTVGASGSTRKIIETTGPRAGEAHILDPDAVYEKSSRGFYDRRIKPDVVAPGFNIFSARSRLCKKPEDTSASIATSNGYPGVYWETLSGSSQATPMVAGCAAIVREILQKLGVDRPPAALIKALLINGADKLPGVDIEAQGFGRVNLQASVDMLAAPPIISATPPILSISQGTLVGKALSQSELFAFQVSTPSQGTKGDFKITLVYNDLEGDAIQNNLNLAVVDEATGEKRYGKMVSADGTELKNNVEQIVWRPCPQSRMTVTVTATDIFNGRIQDFALAWSVRPPYEGFERHIL